MNNLIELKKGVGQLPDTSPLELIRSKAIREVRQNSNLSDRDKDFIIREINFLIGYERLKRLKKTVYEQKKEELAMIQALEDKRREMTQRAIRHRIQMREEIEAARRGLLLKRVQLQVESAKLYLEVLEMIKKTEPLDDGKQGAKKMKEELLKIKLKSKIRRAIQQECIKELEETVLRRANFLRRVREQFPDMEEEIIDAYDQRYYNAGHVKN